MARRTGNDRPNRISGTASADTIDGRGGDDTLLGLGGEDEIVGGAGNDSIAGGDGSDVLMGGAGRDTLDGRSSPADVESGEDFDIAYYFEGGGVGRGIVADLGRGRVVDTTGQVDTLIDIEGVQATTFADRLSSTGGANDGLETFIGLAGDDTIDGGSGFNDLRYHRDYQNGGRGAVVIDFVAGRATDGFGDTDTFANIQRVYGTRLGDTVTGNGGDNAFRMLAGADDIDGGLGFDRLDHRQDSNFGGTRGIDADLARGRIVDGFGDVDRVRNIERVTGTEFADTLRGGDREDVLEGDASNDHARGRAGDDQLVGGDGADTLLGETGADFLGGGAGNDGLTGGGGEDYILGGDRRDTLTGGAQQDIFQFDAPGEGGDVVRDFRGDLIGLDKAGFGIDLPGINFVDGSTFVANRNPRAEVARDTLLYDTDSGVVWFDPDGTAGSDRAIIAILIGAVALNAGSVFFD